MAIALQFAILRPINFGWEGVGVQKLSGTHQLFVECGVKVLSENV